MQNSILEHVKLAEEGPDYMERATQAKRQPVLWDSLEK